MQIDYFAVVSSQDPKKHVSQNLVKKEDRQERSINLQNTPISEDQMPKEIMTEEIFAEVMEGRRENSTIYIIEGYLYYIENHLNTDRISLRCYNYKRKCRGHAQIEKDTLRVIKMSGQHNCDQWMDPDQKVQIQMESKMKDLAMTTKDSFRKIYDDVCLENPAVAVRIPFSRMDQVMRVRRNKAKSNIN